MSTQYIIKFSKLMDEFTGSTNDYDGFVELLPSKGFMAPTMNVRTCKDSSDSNNISLLNKFITKNFGSVDFNDDSRVCNIEYADGYMNSLRYKSQIKFDDSSSSAYSEFKKNLEELLNTSQKTVYYSSGNLKYIGEVLEEEGKVTFNGKGTIYYDNIKNSIKYEGEFEDGYYDGTGTFYNSDGNIFLSCNNISTGIPIKKGKLYINFRGRKEIQEINFTDLWENNRLTDKMDKRDFVNYDMFVNNLASNYFSKSDKTLKELTFEEKSIEDQNVEIWKQLVSSNKSASMHHIETSRRMNNLMSALQTFSLLMFVNIGLTLFTVFMK